MSTLIMICKNKNKMYLCKKYLNQLFKTPIILNLNNWLLMLTNGCYHEKKKPNIK